MGASNKQTQVSIKRQLPYMPSGLWKDLLNICHIQSHTESDKEMSIFIHNTAWQYGATSVTIDMMGNILIEKGKGENIPCVVAHIDTVHGWAENFKVFSKEKDNRKSIFAQNGKMNHGIGGDDKCGIFVAMQCLKKYDNIKVALFVGEEQGCVGSGKVDLDFFNNVGFVLQFDRWGASDMITKTYDGNLCSKSFVDTIKEPMKQYGFKKAHGMLTDVVELKYRGLNVSCVNISCGYYQHHTANEIIDTNELYNSLLFCYEIINRCDGIKFPHEYDDFYPATKHNKKPFKYPSILDDYDSFKEPQGNKDHQDPQFCSLCDNPLMYWEKEFGLCDYCINT